MRLNFEFNNEMFFGIDLENEQVKELAEELGICIESVSDLEGSEIQQIANYLLENSYLSSWRE